MDISCSDSSKKMRITSIFFGKFIWKKCNIKLSKMIHCSGNISKGIKKIYGKCNNKNTCTLTASRTFMRLSKYSCPGYAVYLEVTYKCS